MEGRAPAAGQPLQVHFRDGLLWIAAVPGPLSEFFRPHPSGSFVAPAYLYRRIVDRAAASGVPFQDHASEFSEVNLDRFSEDLDPFDFQSDAIKAWEAAGRRGTVVLPTGAGKSYMTRLLIAALGMQDASCSTLVVVPTRLLMYQWHIQLQRAFGQRIGLVGDDILDVQPVTVTTYTSARMQMSWFGNRWKLMVFDELHRKLSTGPSGNAARFAIAPFRLGLTATPVEKEQAFLSNLVGPVVYRRTTEEMIERDVLSVFRRVIVQCRPTEEEVRSYFEHRRPMDDLWHVAKDGHRVRGSDWFLHERGLRPDAAALAVRSVLRAHRYWESIPSRLLRLREILQKHVRDRILVFVDSRATAYEISRRFLIPAITADIGGDEREVYLRAFSEGRCRALVTARALEEGIDLPQANVAVILAGRRKRKEETIQYVQRRGRILRKCAGKEATVYEISWSIPRDRGGAGT